MVENQQSIKNVLSFGAKSVDPKILEHLLVGREKNADYLFKSIEGIVNNGNNQQILVIGQRGMGKTHLLHILYHRCQIFIKEKQLIVAYFSEEEYGVSSFFDFLTRILYSFIRWNENDKYPLKDKLEDLQNTRTAGQIPFIKQIIKDYISDRPLLILAENFGDILNRMGNQEQGKLRAWMYENSRINIIATSQSISDDFDSEDRPFYGFFNLYYLKTLSLKDSLHFLISLAKLDNRPDVVDHLKSKGKAQVKAINELVKGNHRLLVTFYEFLKSDTLAKLSNHFIKTINDLKPYYETYIRYLPPQQQKILRYIALSRKPQQGTSISKNCFIDQKSLSKQLSELVRKNLLEVISDRIDKRNKLYDINEPLLRISIEVGEHKEGITALFIDFLALYYDEDELTTKRLKFTDLLEKCDNFSEKMAFQYEIQAIEKAIKLKNPNSLLSSILEKLIELFLENDSSKGYSFLEKKKNNLDSKDYNYLLSLSYVLDKKYEKALDIFPLFSADYLKNKKLYLTWGFASSQLAKKENNVDLYKEAIKIFKKASENNEGNEFLYSEWGNALISLALFGSEKSLFLEGFNKLNKAIEYNSNNENYYLDLAQGESAYSMHLKNDTYSKRSLKSLISALKLNNESIRLFILWGGSISFSHNIIKSDPFNISLFKENFSRLSTDSRLPAWKAYAGLHHLYFLTEMYPILKSDILLNNNQLESILIDWITNILANNANSLQKEDLAYLRTIAIEMGNEIPELKITQIYIDTFDEYILNKNKNAIFELPKEQRLFFQKNILEGQG